jgi:hypothetical protein
MYLFIHFISLHVSSIKCSSSGDWFVLIHHLVWLVSVSDCLVCQSGGSFPPACHTKQSHTQTNHTRWCIKTIQSPDAEHLMLETCREMKWINKYMKKCISLFINTNLWRDSRSTKYKILLIHCWPDSANSFKTLQFSTLSSARGLQPVQLMFHLWIRQKLTSLKTNQP